MLILNGEIDISSLLNAQARFEEYRHDISTDKDKTAASKAFEYCYELSWKMLKRILNKRGIEDINSPKVIFREAAKDGLIEDPEVWFSFQRQRNLAAHTYDDENLEAVVSEFDHFSAELAKLVNTLKGLS